MRLEDLISELSKQHPKLVVRWGFTGSGHSDRGDYSNLAFEPKENSSVEEMLLGARGALGQIYTGYKGGEYKMEPWTDCFIGEWGGCGEEITPTLLRYAFSTGYPKQYCRLESLEEKL